MAGACYLFACAPRGRIRENRRRARDPQLTPRISGPRSSVQVQRVQEGCRRLPSPQMEMDGWMAVPPLSPQAPRPSLSSSPLALLRSRRRGRDRPPHRRPCISPSVVGPPWLKLITPSSPPSSRFISQRGVHPPWHGRRRHPHPPQRLQGRLHGRRDRRRRRAPSALPRAARPLTLPLVFLDLPAPWDAVPHAKAALRVRPPALSRARSR